MPPATLVAEPKSVHNLEQAIWCAVLLPLTPLTPIEPDAFADVGEEALDDVPSKKAALGSGTTNYIHIRIQQRNGRKTITTLQGVPTEYDPKKLLKAFKKEFACNGSLVQDEEMGQVIQLQGDQRTKILAMLTEEGISTSLPPSFSPLLACLEING